MTIALINSGAVQDDTPSITLTAGTNRLLIAIPNMERSAGTFTVSSLAMGGQSFAKVPNITAGGNLEATWTNGAGFQHLGAWYANEATIAAMANGNGTITWSAAPNGTGHFHYSLLSGVDQSDPFVDSALITTTSESPLALPTITGVAGGYLVGGVSSGNTLETYTFGGDLDNTDIFGSISSGCASRAAAATSPSGDANVSISTTGPDGRLGLLGITLRPAAGGAAFANPLPLLGVGRAA